MRTGRANEAHLADVVGTGKVRLAMLIDTSSVDAFASVTPWVQVSESAPICVFGELHSATGGGGLGGAG